MKLPIKKEYFELIKRGGKMIEYRDAHITFVCEETGEQCLCDILKISMIKRPVGWYPDVLEDDYMIVFDIKKKEGGSE